MVNVVLNINYFCCVIFVVLFMVLVNIMVINLSFILVFLIWLLILNEYFNGLILEYRVIFWELGSDNLEKRLWKKVIDGERLFLYVINLEKFIIY